MTGVSDGSSTTSLTSVGTIGSGGKVEFGEEGLEMRGKMSIEEMRTLYGKVSETCLFHYSHTTPFLTTSQRVLMSTKELMWIVL